MIDTAIESHIREKLLEAYPDIDDNQIIVRFPLSMFEKPLSKRGDAIGQERLTVIAIVMDADKLDRKAFIQLMPRCRLDFDGISAEQIYIKTEQKDFIEIVKTKGIIFTVQYLYDL